jgi:RimJ/RimL family protein N-acetyltransferase
MMPDARLELDKAVDDKLLEGLVATSCRSRLMIEGPFVGEPVWAHAWAEISSALEMADAESIVVTSGGVPQALCVLRVPAWDREHFGFVVGRVEHLVARTYDAAEAAVRWGTTRLSELGAAMTSARVPAEDLVAIRALEAAGFRYIEHVLTPWRSWDSWERKGYSVTRPTETADVEALCDIARVTFRTDRFHMDGRFDSHDADGVYARWIETWHADPPSGARSRVIVIDGRVCGFFMYRFFEPAGVPGRRVTDLVLGGMAPGAAGRGQGYRMYCDVMDDAAENTHYGRVTIVTANVAVLNLYAKLGFRFTTGGEVTLHRWSD